MKRPEAKGRDSAVGISAKAFRRVPWVHFVYLAVCFFLVVHDPMASTWDVNRPAETFAATAGSGSWVRRLSFLMLTAYGLFHVVRSRRNRLKRQGVLGTVTLLLFVWTFLSYTWSQSPYTSAARLLGIFSLTLVAAALCLRFKPWEIIRWIGLTTLCFTALGIACELVLGTFHPGSANYRFSGTLSPNEQGVNCALGAIASWYLWRRGLHRTFWLCGLAVAILFAFLTKSRTAFLSVLVALVLFEASIISHWRNRFLLWSVAAVILVSGVWLQESGIVQLQGGLRLGRDARVSDAGSLTGRVPLWKELLAFSARHQALGYGYGGFWTPDRVVDVSEDQGWGVSASHSAYVEMLLALGPIGVCLYTFSLLLSLYRVRDRFLKTSNQTFAFIGTLQMFCLINGIADSSSVIVSSFLCFCTILSLFFVGFVPSTVSKHNQIQFRQPSPRVN